MNEVDRYIREVLRNISATSAQRDRIEADLRAHLQEAIARGESPEAVIARMGDPVQVAAEFMAQIPLRFAGFWQRLAAFGLDVAIVIVIAAVPTLVAIALASSLPHPVVGLVWVLGAMMIAAIVACALAVAGVLVLYFPISEGRFGQTLGKRLLGLRVLKEDGLPIGYKEAFLRRLSSYFEILPLDIAFIPFTPKRQRAFDMVARTIVVQETENQRSRWVYAAAVVVTFPLLLVCACARPQGQSSALSSGPQGHIANTFQSFTGIERGDLQVEAGRRIHLEYRATLTEGSIEIRAEGPAGQVLWSLTLPGDGKSSHSSADVPILQTGHYALVAEGHQAAGSLDLTWDKK